MKAPLNALSLLSTDRVKEGCPNIQVDKCKEESKEVGDQVQDLVTANKMVRKTSRPTPKWAPSPTSRTLLSVSSPNRFLTSILEIILKGQAVGEGIKRTPAYDT